MRRLLLDTCVVLWVLSKNSRLSGETLRQIEEPLNEIFVSAATSWEIAIKRSLGKLDAPDNLSEELVKARFSELQVTISHGENAARLPPIHRDPFDRMLIAQAQAENLTLVTSDPEIWRYDVQVLCV